MYPVFWYIAILIIFGVMDPQGLMDHPESNGRTFTMASPVPNGSKERFANLIANAGESSPTNLLKITMAYDM